MALKKSFKKTSKQVAVGKTAGQVEKIRRRNAMLMAILMALPKLGVAGAAAYLAACDLPTDTGAEDPDKKTDDPKEEPKEEPKDNPKDEPKEDSKTDESKTDESKTDESKTDEPKEEPKEEPTDNPKDESKEDSKTDEPEEDPKTDDPKTDPNQGQLLPIGNRQFLKIYNKTDRANDSKEIENARIKIIQAIMWLERFNEDDGRAWEKVVALELEFAVEITETGEEGIAGDVIRLPLDGWCLNSSAGWAIARDYLNEYLDAQPDPEQTAQLSRQGVDLQFVLGGNVLHQFNASREAYARYRRAVADIQRVG
jgi:hypothetical protein